MITLSIILTLVITISFFVVRNLIQKNEKLEDFISKQSEAINACDQRLKQLDDKKVLMDKQGLILAGADRALREMLSIFRDDPIEGPLQEASMGVWTKILQEES